MDSKITVSIEAYEAMVKNYNKKYSTYLKAKGLKKSQIYAELEKDNAAIELACKNLPKR